MANIRDFKSEMDYQRYALKGDIALGRSRMMEVLPNLIENAHDLQARLKDFTTDQAYCNNNDMYKWFQRYADDLREANRMWYEASQKMKVLDALEASYKAEEKKLFQR
jgi:hypothetical protein